jgi:hypothetical protein
MVYVGLPAGRRCNLLRYGKGLIALGRPNQGLCQASMDSRRLTDNDIRPIDTSRSFWHNHHVCAPAATYVAQSSRGLAVGVPGRARSKA